MKLLIGIDDTDNKESRGTGYRARKLGELIQQKKLGTVTGITRHQLFVDPRIPYTSQNSSACIEVMTSEVEKLKVLCRSFLLEDSAEGSDVGLCIRAYGKIPKEIIQWGQQAKKQVLSKKKALELADNHEIFLEGLTGTHDGIIGALAAIGLRRSGNDGRFIWLKGKELRELSGAMEFKEIKNKTGIQEIFNKKYEPIQDTAIIDMGEWVRPILKDHKPTIIVEEEKNNERIYWKCVSKEYIKSISN